VLVAQPGLRTITGMLAGARLAGVWHHARAHRFFAAARWSADTLGLGVCDLIVGVLLGPDAPIVLVVDDSTRVNGPVVLPQKPQPLPIRSSQVYERMFARL
jgi:DDE superfamily endonuclease